MVGARVQERHSRIDRNCNRPAFPHTFDIVFFNVHQTAHGLGGPSVLVRGELRGIGRATGADAIGGVVKSGIH